MKRVKYQSKDNFMPKTLQKTVLKYVLAITSKSNLNFGCRPSLCIKTLGLNWLINFYLVAVKKLHWVSN